ncbi:o-succinylbenzoate--CoA ligase [Chungangia koreensis]|uniref:2-succinylbenzoate--CoA ligase n=1 Tax=Chungangia koreensis TaxID=752657 RepID=A0ABV8X4H8_9LACT
MYPNWLVQRAKLTPDRIGLSFENIEWTFKEILEEALLQAGCLLTAGVKKESRVAILSSSHPQLVFGIHACLQLSAELVMLNERLSESEIHYQISDADPDFVLVDSKYKDKVIGTGKPILSWDELKELRPEEVKVELEWPSDRTITIMYTSGTTGFPKGVRQTVENHTTSATGSAFNMGVSPDDVWLCTSPIFHISGFSILVRSLLYGMRVRLYQKFDLAPIVDELTAGEITRMSVVAVTLERILSELERREEKVHPNFKTMLAGGGPIPSDYLNRAFAKGIPVLQTYGMTETSSQAATLAPEDAIRKLGSSGKPLFLTHIRIDGAAGPNVEGEICVRGGNVTPGYVGRNEERPAQIDGWLHTGDIGYIDEEGYLYVVDRRSDLIISGGENIYPAEVENALVKHPNVREAGVCGVDDTEWGQVPAAFVVLNCEVREEELMDFARTVLAGYKVPKAIKIVNELPRNASNKLMRRRLTEYL